jgi:signal transduction histidine kinase
MPRNGTKWRIFALPSPLAAGGSVLSTKHLTARCNVDAPARGEEKVVGFDHLMPGWLSSIRLRLRTSLVVLVGLSLIPAMVFSGLVVRELWRQQLHEVGETMRQTNAALAIAVERELASTIRALRAIGESPALTTGTLADVHHEHQRLLSTQPGWSAIVLLTADGVALSDTRAPLGTPLATFADRSHIAQVAVSLQPTISDVFLDGSRGHTVEVAVPVMRAGRLTHMLATPLRLERLRELFLTADIVRGEGVAGILDSELRFVARAREPERWVGKGPTPEFAARLRSTTAGFGRFKMLEGDYVYTAWAPTAHGWRVAIGVPAEPMDGALRRSLLWVLVAGLAAFGLSIAAAMAWSGRLSGAIGRAATAAARLGRGAPPRPASSVIAELHALQAAHVDVDARLRQEHEQRQRSEADRLRLLAMAEVARAEAERTNRAKDEFLAMLGHELRNPLAAIGHAATVLDLPDVPAGRAAAARQVLQRQVRHLARIVDDLLDVARITTGHIMLDLQPVNLAQTVGKCLASLAEQLRGRPLVQALEPIWVRADETRIEQIVSNLMTNAAKYTPADRPIRVSVSREGTEAVLRVEDEGIGIPASLLPRVFDLFVQGPRAADRRIGGLGLGLTLVRRLVELHGGRIEAASPGPDHGSVFTVWLPEHALPAASELSPAPQPAVQPRQVLIVEDNADACAMLRSLLESARHKVYDAPDGPTGVEAALRLDVDVALIDLGLPGFDGYEVARRIRAARGSSIRLVSVSGYGQPEHHVRAREAGFDAFLVKPVSFEMLEQVIAPAT